eukprot:845931-Amphidinium_carterae.1
MSAWVCRRPCSIIVQVCAAKFVIGVVKGVTASKLAATATSTAHVIDLSTVEKVGEVRSKRESPPPDKLHHNSPGNSWNRKCCRIIVVGHWQPAVWWKAI